MTIPKLILGGFVWRKLEASDLCDFVEVSISLTSKSDFNDDKETGVAMACNWET